MEEKRKILSRWEWIMLIIVALIILNVLLSKVGIHIINTKEETEVIHHTRQ